MLSLTIADLKSDIAPMMKGTSIRSISDHFENIAFKASSRMSSRIDPPELIRTGTLSMPFYDNVNDYVLATDFKRMIGIRPTAGRQDMPGLSDFGYTSTKQFLQRLDSNSLSIRWNSMVRTLRAQRLPAGNVVTVDEFDSLTGNGSWAAAVDASGLAVETLNFVQGSTSLRFDLSGSTGAGNLVNSTAAVLDLSANNNEDASMIFFYIPVGKSARFTNFKLRRGDSASAYIEQTVTTKADGTAFTDGWNYLYFDWNTGTTTGSPTNTSNIYRYFGVTYTAGTAITGCLIDSWTNSLGSLYEIEYYSEYMFRTAAGVWIARPTDDTDLLNVGPASYEIFKTEMMVDITQIIRTGQVRNSELADWRMMLNGQSASRWVKDPPYHGLYADFTARYPSEAITLVTRTYDFDV